VSLISKYYPSANDTDEQMVALKELTGLEERPPILGSAFDEFVKKLSKKLNRLGDRAVDAAEKDASQAPASAAELVRLQEAFAALPDTDSVFEKWWSELTQSSGIDSLREQGIMISKAKQLEDDHEQAIEAYQEVISKYPDSSAAALSENKISLLKNPSSDTINNASRVWHSKGGSYTIEATLLSFDGKTARLKRADGKEIDVPVDSLSDSDQQHLKSKQ